MTKVKPWTPVPHPFTDSYYQRELRAVNRLRPGRWGAVEVTKQSLEGRYAGYLYDAIGRLDGFPILYRGEGDDRNLWMSVTPMEVESQFSPLLHATGRVGVGGLGIGYVVQRLLAKRGVERVDVWETDPDVIAFYRDVYGDHSRLHIHHADVRTVRGEEFDLFYMDIYRLMLEDATWSDWRLMIEHNDIGFYHPWGIEAALYGFAVEQRWDDVPFSLRHVYGPFIKDLAVSTALRMAVLTRDYPDPDDTARLWEANDLEDYL